MQVFLEEEAEKKARAEFKKEKPMEEVEVFETFFLIIHLFHHLPMA